MDAKILSQLVKSINPNKVYDYEFNEVRETKTGKDWIGTFISEKRQLSTADGNILIKHFSEIIEESQPKNLKSKNK